jgi:hypothetical protein
MVIRPWPEWLPLAEAAEYARMSSRRLKSLVACGRIIGYANPEDRRGPKGEGVWWIKRSSIDAYHEELSGGAMLEAAFLATKERMGV